MNARLQRILSSWLTLASGILTFAASLVIIFATEHHRHVETSFWHNITISKKGYFWADAITIPLQMVGIAMIVGFAAARRSRQQR